MVVVIAILATMLFPMITNMMERMARANCTMNLKALFVGTELYLQDNRIWPQIDTSLLDNTSSDEYARQWIKILAPYKISENTWHCPTIEKTLTQGLKNKQKQDKRIDYYPMPFDDKEITPHRWSTQPWFIERGAVHGNGNLMIFTDGSVKNLGDMLYRKK